MSLLLPEQTTEADLRLAIELVAQALVLIKRSTNAASVPEWQALVAARIALQEGSASLYAVLPPLCPLPLLTLDQLTIDRVEIPACLIAF